MNVSSQRQKRILITGARAPAALHLARLLGDGGHHVVMGDTLRWPLGAASRACADYVRFRSPVDDWAGFSADIKQSLTDHKIDLVVPTCEEVFHLAQLWEQGSFPASLYASPLNALAMAHNKFAFIEKARTLGLAVPETRLLTSPDDISPEDTKRVLKPVWSRFGEQVLIQPDARALATLQPSEIAPWVSQEFVEGREICVMAFARQGQVLGMAAYHPLYRAGPGAAIYFDPVVSDATQEFVRCFVAGTQWTGQISFDLIEREDGAVLPFECNPRATSGLHFFRDPISFCDALLADGGTMETNMEAAQSVPLAMMTYGLGKALRTGTLRKFKRDFSRQKSALDWPDDSAPVRRQLLPVAEFAARALYHRCSLLQATTRDIEWNGPQAG